MVDLRNFPVIIANGATQIVGEVYAVSAEVLARLDYLEGHPRNYRRETIGVENFGGVYAYIWPHNNARLKRIPSGNWREYATTGDDLLATI